MASLLLLLVMGCGAPVADVQEGMPTEGGSAAAVEKGRRAVSVRGVEVDVPATWADDWEAVRPDCIDPGARRDPWAADVPEAPYVTLGADLRPVPLIGCVRERGAGDPGPEWGDLPFALWQPHVGVEEARPDLRDPTRTDGTWQHRGWRLTRATVAGVQVTVLAPPGHPELGREVVASARPVTFTALGCESTSPVKARRWVRPTGAPLPSPEDVAAVAVCEHARRRAASTPGPAIALRFFGDVEETVTPSVEAYVYYDSFAGNGVVDAAEVRP